MSDQEKARRLETAQRLFKQYYASCFWPWKCDLVITEDLIPAIVKGLRVHGGRSAFLEADRLEKAKE